MIVTCREMRDLEERAFAKGASGTSAEALMDEAGRQIAAAVQQFHPTPGECRVFFGKGHNGGDALVAARHLMEAGWQVVLEEVYPQENLAPLTAAKLAELNAARQGLLPIGGMPEWPLVVLDGLLGIGAEARELRSPVLEAAARINQLRQERAAVVFAIDLPTGLGGDTGKATPGAVEADVTLTIGFAKAGLVADEAVNHVGRLALLELPGLTPLAPLPTDQGLDEWPTVSTPSRLRPLLPRRRFDTHKGDCGRVGIMAGSKGFAGAATLAANAAVRGGAGLVTLYVKEEIYTIAAASVRPEVMVRPVEHYRVILDDPLDVLAMGPGLGHDFESEETVEDLMTVLVNCPAPAVLDADALNLLSSNPDRLGALMQAAGPRLLTPHPGEMRRLHPKALSLGRREAAHDFLKQFRGSREPVTLLLKGARTLIAEEPPGHSLRLAYNTTGSPGMATGGMGDVLTGLLAALMGQGLEPFDAARLGAWVSGRTAEVLLSHGWQSPESLLAGDQPEFFGTVFQELQSARELF